MTGAFSFGHGFKAHGEKGRDAAFSRDKNVYVLKLVCLASRGVGPSVTRRD